MDRDAELEELIAEQEADDRDQVDPERFGAGGEVKVVSLEVLGETTRTRPIWGKRGLESNEVTVVRHAIEQAPEEQQEVFRLVFEERLTQREAAERLGISQSAVRDRLARLQKQVAKAVLA